MNLRYLHIVICLLTGALGAQNAGFSLKNAGLIQFNGSLYCYGLNANHSNTDLKIFMLTPELALSDSFSVSLGKSKPEDFLEIQCDTLHNYLNVYIHKKDKKVVTVFRFAGDFKPVTKVENVEIPRLNNKMLFAGKSLYSGRDVYCVVAKPDSGGKQFYMNKYTLKDEKKNFDYDLKWQFPFERKNIYSALPVYAGIGRVYLFVIVSQGPKTGQWILCINASNGMLLKGTRISDKDDNSVCMYSNFIFDTGKKTLHLAGPKFPDTEVDYASDKFLPGNEKTQKFYHVIVDSLGEVEWRQEFSYAIVQAKSGQTRAKSKYIARVHRMEKDQKDNIVLELDLFRSAEKGNCFNYINTVQTRLINSAGKYVPEKAILSCEPLIEQFYFTGDRLDLNGKICSDSALSFEDLFFRPANYEVKMCFRKDETAPAFVLRKVIPKRDQVIYSLIMQKDRKNQVVPLCSFKKSQEPFLIGLSPHKAVMGSRTGDDRYDLKIYDW